MAAVAVSSKQRPPSAGGSGTERRFAPRPDHALAVEGLNLTKLKGARAAHVHCREEMRGGGVEGSQPGAEVT